MQTMKIVRFYEDEMQVVPGSGKEDTFVVLKPACDALGISLQRQLDKLKEAPWATVTIMVTVGKDGKNREMATITLKSLPLWLATIQANRVAPEARAKLIRYQQRCADGKGLIHGQGFRNQLD